MNKIIDYDFFPLRHDFFTHYKVKAIRKEYGHEGVLTMLVIWSYLQEKGGFLDPSNEALIEDLAETHALSTAQAVLKLCSSMAQAKLKLLELDESGRYFNREILVRLGKMKENRASYAERGSKGGKVTAAKKASSAQAKLQHSSSSAQATSSRVEESRELPLGSSNTIRSTTYLSGDDTPSNLAPPIGGSVLVWSPETKVADFIAAGFGLSHTDMGKAVKQYQNLADDVKKIAFEKAGPYLKQYREKYPNGEPSLTAYFSLEIWKR